MISVLSHILYIISFDICPKFKFNCVSCVFHDHLAPSTSPRENGPTSVFSDQRAITYTCLCCSLCLSWLKQWIKIYVYLGSSDVCLSRRMWEIGSKYRYFLMINHERCLPQCTFSFWTDTSDSWEYRPSTCLCPGPVPSTPSLPSMLFWCL